MLRLEERPLICASKYVSNGKNEQKIAIPGIAVYIQQDGDVGGRSRQAAGWRCGQHSR